MWSRLNTYLPCKLLIKNNSGTAEIIDALENFLIDNGYKVEIFETCLDENRELIIKANKN